MKPGDYFVVRTCGPVGWLIRIGTRSEFDHAGIVGHDTGYCYEAEPGCTQWTGLE